MSENRVVRDPIYGYISVPAELVGLIDHPLFQRLRRISQTSLTQYVYPTATGTRFEHALGSMHLAGRAWEAIWRREVATGRTGEAFIAAAKEQIPDLPADATTFGEAVGLAFRAAALLHDVGHTPFSHALEGVYRDYIWKPDSSDRLDLQLEVREGKTSFHEYCGRLIARRICEEVFVDPDSEVLLNGVDQAILHILHGGPGSWAAALHGLISGQIDVDRVDYLIRDSDKAAGSEFGSVDYIRLLDALELRHENERPMPFQIRPGLRARSAVETLLIQRLQAYEYIHFHPRVVGYNLALERATELFLRISDSQEVPREPSIETLFRGLRPNFVYWDPAQCDLPGALALWQPPRESEPGEQTSMFEGVPDPEHFLEALATNPGHLQAATAGVDDGTILETLKHAYLLQGTAPPRYLSDPIVADQVRQLMIFSRAALFRRKNFMPAWKSVEEYVEAAGEMQETLLAQAPAHLLARAEELRDSSAEMTKAIAERLEKAGEGSRDDRVAAVIALNTLVDMLLSRPEMLAEIRNGLNRLGGLGDHKGVWDVAYTGSGTVERLEVDLQGKRGPVSIIERSPLAEAVWFSEERRMKLAVYFFFENRDFSEAGGEGGRSLRGRIRKQVVENLPGIVLEAIDAYV